MYHKRLPYRPGKTRSKGPSCVVKIAVLVVILILLLGLCGSCLGDDSDAGLSSKRIPPKYLHRAVLTTGRLCFWPIGQGREGALLGW